MYKNLLLLASILFFNACDSNLSKRDRKDKFSIQKTWQENKNAKKQTSYKNGKDLYRPCIACHGQQGEKKQFGSDALKGWDKQSIINALKGYQNDTYGRDYKPTMKLHVKRLTDEQITLIAEYIETF